MSHWEKVFKYGGFSIKPFPLVHDVPCYGFYITEPSMGTCIYASDTSYIKYRFKNLNHILIEANHSQGLINRDLPQYEHILRGHMSLETTLQFLMVNDNPALKNVVLIHLSDKNADSADFLQKTKETIKYGADCYIAEKGLCINLDLVPF